VSAVHAGTYVWQTRDATGKVTAQSPVYSGGTFTYTGSACGNNPIGQLLPFAFNSADGYYEDSISNGCVPDAQGRATTCSTTLTGMPLTAKFLWQPAYPSEPPPANVIVCQNGYASGHTAYSAGNCVITYMCNDGLGGSITSDGICKDTKWSVQSPAGDGSVSLTCTSSSAFTGNSGTVGWYGAPPCANGIVSLGYSANVYPVTVSLVGTTLDSLHNSNILVGQNCTPYLNIPGLPSSITVGWPTWSVSGDTFTSFYISAGQSTGWAVPFPDPSANLSLNPPPANPTFFWKDANISGFPETVQGSAVLYNTPLGALYNPNLPPSAQIGTVTASKKVQIQRPDVYSTPPTVGPHGVLEPTVNPMLGTVGINTGTSEVVSNDPSGNGSGYYLQIAVATPDLFTQGETKFGNWAWLQLCQLDVTQGGNGTQMATPELDSSFPYNNAGSVANGVPGSTYDAQLSSNGNPAYDGFDDSPSEQYYNYFLRYDTALSFDNNFHIYVMYEPPDVGNGANYVPVDMYNWEFTASMTRSGLSGSWTPNPPGLVKDLGSAPYPQYPTWTSKYSP